MIKENVKKLLEELPPGVLLEAAAKTRTIREILEAVEAGVPIIGQNYIQEAAAVFESVRSRAQLHFIGHLQRNKVKKAVDLFDLIETIDSLRIAQEIDKQCGQINKTVSVLVEINSGRETQKFGIFPEEAEKFVRELSILQHIRVLGLMTMGPYTGDPEEARPCFTETRSCFEHLKDLEIPNVTMQYLSMGMTNSYQVAIEEGANIIRIGTKIFGERGSSSATV
jgi:pyridoxal phosphate enzyme (YggS family)